MVRPRRDDDLDRCVGLLRDVHATDAYPAKWPDDASSWIEGTRTVAAWVAERDGELVGHLSLTAAHPARAWPQWREAVGLPAARLAVISRFFVSPRARNLGIGTELMDFAEREARGRDLCLVLDVAHKNRPAIAFYEDRGWLRVGEATLRIGDGHRDLPLVLFVASRDGTRAWRPPATEAGPWGPASSLLSTTG